MVTSPAVEVQHANTASYTVRGLYLYVDITCLDRLGPALNWFIRPWDATSTGASVAGVILNIEFTIAWSMLM